MDSIIVRTPRDPRGVDKGNRFDNASAYTRDGDGSLVIVHGSNASLPVACVPIGHYPAGEWRSYRVENDGEEVFEHTTEPKTDHVDAAGYMLKAKGAGGILGNVRLVPIEKAETEEQGPECDGRDEAPELTEREIIEDIRGTLVRLAKSIEKLPRHRSYSVAVTKLEEAEHWLFDRFRWSDTD